MKRLLAGLLGAMTLAGSGAAIAQPYPYYPAYAPHPYYDGGYYVWSYGDGRYIHHRRHYAYPYRYYYGYRYAPVRRCAWSYGERVCRWTR